MTYVNPDDALPVHLAIAGAVADYRRVFPAPLPLAQNLTLAVRALEERDEALAKLEAIRALHPLGTWHEPWTGSNGRNPDGYWHDGCLACEAHGPCDTLSTLDKKD